MIHLTRRHFAAAALSLSVAASTGAMAADEDAVIGVTGAAGQLGRLVVDALLETVPAERIVALVRSDDERAAALAEKGVTVRVADYADSEALTPALAGIDRLLLISSTGANRVAQHGNVIDTAKEQGVRFIAYTSFLHAATAPMTIRVDHAATEDLLAESGLAYAVLRNGWYAENYAGETANALRNGEIVGAYGDGRIAPATRADYAAAAAAVLTAPDGENRIYELAGDDSFTMAELAAEISRQSGRDIAYRNLSEAEYRDVLIERGLPEAAAANSAASHAAMAQGALFDDSGDLSRLIGRPTTSWRETVAAAVRAEEAQD